MDGWSLTDCILIDNVVVILICHLSEIEHSR